MKDLEKKCYGFVLQCYFGDMTNPVDAAINRAYSDMASHTLKGFAESEYKSKWACRYKASAAIREALNDDKMRQSYDDWHCEICKKLQQIYDEKQTGLLTYGQAQKWVNMTAKYLLVFAVIFKNMDEKEKLKRIPTFFRDDDSIQKLHIPLDNYIMKQYNVSSFGSWSKMSCTQYEDCRSQIKDKTLKDELVDWGMAANAHKADDKKSYAAYVEEHGAE